MILWKLIDHLCKSCGGRMLQSVSGTGPTGGGNPIVRCADCGGSECWCEFSHKLNNNRTAYRCVPYKILDEKPELLKAFYACGCDPKRGGEIGIMLESDLYKRSENDLSK